MAVEAFNFLTGTIPKWLQTLQEACDNINSYSREIPLSTYKQEEDVHLESPATAHLLTQFGHFTQVHHQQNVASGILPNAKHHAPQNQHPTPGSQQKLPQQSHSSKRKRAATTLSTSAAEKSVPVKQRPRTTTMVYYNGDAQKGLAGLVSDISSGRNTLRQGALATLADRLTAASNTRPGASSANLFYDMHKILEKAQSYIEDAAWEVLRFGDCDTEMDKAREKLQEALTTSETGLARAEERKEEEEEEKDRMKERTLRPRLSHIALVQHHDTTRPLVMTYDPSTKIEVDDEDEEGEYEIALPAVRLMSRRGPRVG